MGNLSKMKYLKKIDTIGYPISFTHERDQRFRTRTGGIISIFILISYLVLFYVLGEDDYFKQNPQSFYQRDPIAEDFKINLTESTFLGGVEISGLGKKLENKDRIFKPIWMYNWFVQEGDFRKIVPKILPTISCDKVKIGKEIDTHIFNLSNYACPDLSEVKDV